MCYTDAEHVPDDRSDAIGIADGIAGSVDDAVLVADVHGG
jgi:hypothetical protein